MLNIRGVKVYTQDELLNNLAVYIAEDVSKNIREAYIGTISSGVAGMIDETKEYVQGYLKKALRLER